MSSKREQVALLSLLSGDKTLGRFGELMLDDEQKRANRSLPMHLGSGFLYDPASKSTSQDAGYAEFEKEKHRQALELYNTQQDAQFNRELRAEDRQIAREDRARGRTVNTGTTKLSSSLASAKIPELERSIQTVGEILAPFLESGEDIPGMGGVFNVAPGLTKDARQVDMARRAVENALLLAQSGAAVTEHEYERFKRAFGRSVFNTDEDFIKAWNDFKNTVSARLQNIYAGFDDDVVENYGRNLDRSSDDDDGGGETSEQEWAIQNGKPVRVR